MSTGEDEPSPSLNGRLRPRRSTSTTTPSPRNKIIRKTDRKLAQDRPKRTSTPSKASPAKQDDLATKSDAAPVPLLLCPYCDRKFNARQTASKHARRIHLSSSKQDNFIKCLYCNHSDAEPNGIIKHMVDSHPNQYFACLDCHTRFPSTTELAEHKHNVCEKQKPLYRSKLRQKNSPSGKKSQGKSNRRQKEKTENLNGSTQHSNDFSFNSIVISCELKPSMHDAGDIEDKITTNLILPSSKALGNVAVEKSAVIVLDDLQWNKRIPPNFSFHNSDADQILSRLGVVHRSPRVGESRKDLIKMMDEPNEKFEKCFDTNFYSKVTKNVQENLAKFLDGTFNFNPNKDTTIKTRKSKANVLINTAEGFPILLAHEQFSRNLFDGFMPRAVAPKHKWKWDNTENDKNLFMLLDQTKRDSHVNNCIVTLISSLDIWTQLRMKSKFEEIFKSTPTAKKIEKQNIISLELKEILESRDIPSNSTYVAQQKRRSVEGGSVSELCAYLGLSETSAECELKPAVLSGEWVRPRCYVCCACGDQTRDARTLTAHLATRHPNAQVQHYEIVGETLLSADILKHLYVPPSQMSNRTRLPRGFRDCTKCKKSVTLEDLHQHMLDCAGDTPAVRRKCRYRPFGVRRRRPRLPDNTIRKKVRKHIRSRHVQKSHMRPRPRIRTEVGDAETIRKMIADLPAKRNRITPTNILRPRRPILKNNKQVKLRAPEDKKAKHLGVKSLTKLKKAEVAKKQNDADNSSTIDEDDQPLKLSATRILTRKSSRKDVLLRRATLNKTKKKKQSYKQDPNMKGYSSNHYNYNTQPAGLGQNESSSGMSRNDVSSTVTLADVTSSQLFYSFPNHLALEQSRYSHTAIDQIHQDELNAQLANRVSHSHSASEYSHQRIDVKNAGPSNVRQHSSRDHNNMQNGKDRSAGGGDNNQNNSTAQTPNGPLKHSIASLTSDTEIRDTPVYHHSCLLPPELNTTFVHLESENGRSVFENEASVEKVDKPPLSNISTRSKNLNDQRPVTGSAIAVKVSETTSPCGLIGSRNMKVTAVSPNKLIESPAINEQMFLQRNAIGFYECPQQTPYFEEKEINLRKLSISKNSKELVGINKEQKTAPSNTETKIETDKTKSNKTRKGLNDCIAMLQTIKGFSMSKTTFRGGDDEIAESEIIDLETVDSEGRTAMGPDLSVSIIKTTEDKAKKRKNITPCHSVSSQSKDFAISINRRFSTDQVPIHSGKNYLHQKKVECEYSSQNPNQHECELNLKSLNDSDFDTNKLQLERGTQMEPLLDVPLRSKHLGDENHDLTLLRNMYRNSQGDIPLREEIENFYYSSRANKTVKTLKDFNIPNVTRTLIDVQSKLLEAKEKNIEAQLLFEYSQRILIEIQKGRSVFENSLKTNKTKVAEVPMSLPLVTTSIQAITTITQADSPTAEILSNVKVTSADTSRRTRRKPIKKKITVEQQPDFHSVQSKEQEHVVPAVYNDRRGVEANPIDCNVGIVNSSYLPARSPSQETLALKTPPPPPLPPNSISARRESCKRDINNLDTIENKVENRDNVHLTNLVGSSSGTHIESILNINSFRRNSIELTNAQGISSNYDNLMTRAHREHYEKALKSIAQTSKGINARMINPEGNINENTRFDKSNELHNLYSSGSTFVSVNQDTHGIMHVIPKAFSNPLNKSNSLETKDHYKTTHQNEQYNMIIDKQKSCAEAKEDNYMKVGEYVDTYSSHESNAYKPKSSALSIDINAHMLTSRKTRETYYTRSSSYQSNVPNTFDFSLSSGYNENKEVHDIALRAYHESSRSKHPFPTQTITYSNNMHVQRNTVSCDPVMEEIAPLDLSCDTKLRKERTLDLSNKSATVSNNPCNVSISNEIRSDVCVNPSYLYDYGEKLRNPLQHSLITAESDSNRDSVHQHSLNMPSQKSVKTKNQEMTTSKYTYQPLNTTNTHSTNCTKADSLTNTSRKNMSLDSGNTDSIINNSNANNFKRDQLQPVPPDGHYYIPQNSQKLSPKSIQYRDRQDDMNFEEKETRPAMQVCWEAKMENEPTNKTLGASSQIIDNNIENVNPLEFHTDNDLNSFDMQSESSNDISSRNNSILNINPQERNSVITNKEKTICLENDNMQMEQDAETARKIAMLPEELVKILGTIPKDHRNQLLNVLPQYVSTSHSNVENDTKNTLVSSVTKKNIDLLDEKQNTASYNDSISLSVNTAISPSSVIPKKRHSPSHSRGRLNSIETQTSGTLLPSTLAGTSQYSPVHDDANNVKCFQAKYSTKNGDSKSIVLDPSRNTSEGGSSEITLNDLSESTHSSKTNEAAETDYFSATSAQDLTRKLPIKYRPSNEQTASLRAVRIKTTSSKKSFSDDKQSSVNYSYPTNVATDEKSSLGLSIDVGQACNINTAVLKCDKIKLDHQTRNNNDSEGPLKETVNIKTDCFQNNNNAIDNDNSKTGNETKDENVDNLKDIVPPPPSHVDLQNESVSVSEASNDDKDHPNNTPEQTLSTMQDSSPIVYNFTEQTKSMSYPKSTFSENIISLQKPNVASSDSEIQLESNDVTSNVKCKIVEETICNTEKVVQECTDDNMLFVQFKPSKSNFNKNYTVEEDQSFTYIKSNEIHALSLESEITNVSEATTKIEKSSEEDSEDDETLAVIKQKHRREDFKTKKDTVRQQKRSVNLKNKSVLSGKSQKKADYKAKKGSSRRKKNSKTKIARLTKVTDVTCKNELTRDSDIQKKFDQHTDDKIRNINNIVLPVTTNKIKELNEKEEYNDIVNISNIDKLISNSNKVENSVDMSENKTVEAPDTSAGLHNNLQSKIIAELSNISNKDCPELGVSTNAQLNEKESSTNESQSNPKPTSSNKIDPECSIYDNSHENDSNLLSSVLNNTNQLNINAKDRIDVPETDSVEENGQAQIDTLSIDLQLCSEVNTMPLRRSRRGKSMYVDSSYLEDTDQIEDNTKKTPLTMKRLILSRVEKDNKRGNEPKFLERSCVAIVDNFLITSARPESSGVKKGKLTKRKKSPSSKRISTKVKPVTANEQDEDLADFSNLYGTSGNDSCILRELPNAENKIAEKDFSNDDYKLRAVSETALTLSENTTVVNSEREGDVVGDILTETNELAASIKRKLSGINKPSDLVSSKPKKKCHKKKSLSDFDSDDDKALLETKKIISTEKYSTDDHNHTCSNKSTEENDEILLKNQPTTSKTVMLSTCNDIVKPSIQPSSLNAPSDVQVMGSNSHISHEDKEKRLKSQPTTSKQLTRYTDIPTPTNSTGSGSETRVTCYNRSISNKRPRSSSTSSKDNFNYDPYDIDFIDILETAGPIVKKKGKNFGNSQSAKLYHDHKRHKRVSISREDINKPIIENSKQIVLKIPPSGNAESDSDSSKSDVPLQKYVDERISKIDLKHKNKNDDASTDTNTEKVEAGLNIKCVNLKEPVNVQDTNHNSSEKPGSDNSFVEESLILDKVKKTAKRIIADESTRESEKPVKVSRQSPNTVSIDQTTQKQPNKQKKPRHTLLPHNVESVIETNKEDQLKSDKFMENFGFFSERIPRKSNLLATKKISETFHMICNESDDSFFSYKEKSSRKSSSHESKKKSEIGNNLSAEENSNLLTEACSNLLTETSCNIPTEIDSNLRNEIDGNLPTEIDSNLPTEIDSNLPTEIDNNLPTEIDSNLLANTGSTLPTEIKCSIPTETAISLVTETQANLPIEIGTGISQESKAITVDGSNFDAQAAEPRTDIYPIDSSNVVRIDDSDLDFLAAQAIMDSDEVRSLENDLFSSLREAAEASGGRHCFVGYQNTSDISTTPKDIVQNDSYSQIESKAMDDIEPLKKCIKNKQNKQQGFKDKMYPDIEEIDMFEDKFDKIKRKRRSQAVAAKQVQVVAETSFSAKSRKQAERKKNTKSIKKRYQSSHVPTKGALKGFEGIKISIPTQDLNMPINVSPPRHSKKRRKASRQKKETSDSDSSCNEFDDKDKSVFDRDIYEFKDSDDAELFDLRPSTVMDRFRSMHNKNKFKNKEKDKKDSEKGKGKEKEGRVDTKDSANYETTKKHKYNEKEKGQKKYSSKEEKRGVDKKSATTYGEKKSDESMDGNSSIKTQKGSESLSNYLRNHGDDNGKKETDSAIASTSGLVRDHIEESDYESEMSSPEGDFIIYMSNDINCVCASDNDTEDSDMERGCGRLNCVNKSRNADKNAAIENIFKNNAVRCEKPDLMKEPEKPRPNLDQLFDSLLETESKPNNNTMSDNQKILLKTDLREDISTTSLPVAQHNLIESNDGDQTSILDKHTKSLFDKNHYTTDCSQPLPTNRKNEKNIFKSDERTQGKSEYTSSCQNDVFTDSSSMQMFTFEGKSKENLGYSLMSEESTQVNYSDIIAQSCTPTEEINNKHSMHGKTTKTNTSSQFSKYNSEDEFDIDKPETLNRQYMHLILPAEKSSVCAQTENIVDDYNEESGNESAASKYLKGLSPSEAAKMEIYTMVSAQSTQTVKMKRKENSSSKYGDISQSKSDDEEDAPFIQTRIRLQKYDISEIAHKSKSTKSIQTDKNKGYKSCHYDEEESDDDLDRTDNCRRIEKGTDLMKANIKGYRSSNINFRGDNDEVPTDDAFMAPAARFTTEKKSPRKSDEGISTSHDCSADAFDHLLVDNAGVARQRARRKCTVGKQNVLAEHWSSESEFDGAPARPNSADSVVASAPRKKKSRKKEGHHTSGKKTSRHLSKGDSRSARGRAASGAPCEEGEPSTSGSGRPPPGPKMRARAAHHYWSSEGEETAGPQPQHGWIVGDSHKKLVTMLAHAKGRKRNNAEKHLD